MMKMDIQAGRYQMLRPSKNELHNRDAPGAADREMRSDAFTLYP